MYSFLLIGIAYFVEDKRLKYMILLTCACNLYPILFSYSRTAYMCTFIGLVVIGIMQDRRILLIVVMLLTFYRVILPNSVVERIDLAFLQQGEISQTKEQSSALDVGGVQLDTVGRKELWDKALNYFKEQPLLGIGFDTFRQSEGMITHNMFYRILAEEGLVGMAIFIVFVVTLLRKALRLFRKSPSSLGKGIGLGVFSCIVVHLTGSAAGDTYVFFNMMCVYWLFIGIMASFNNLIDVGQDQGSPTALEQSS
jgi:O-antigen ligase